MKLSLLKVSIIFALFLATTAYGQQQGLSFNYFGGGARSEGMGQAFLGVSDDGTAGSWNPAGLYTHEKTMMVFSYDFLMPRGEYSYYVNDVVSDSYNHSGNLGALNFWNIVTPIRVKGHHVVMNMSYTRNFETYYQFSENLFSSWMGNEPNAFIERHGGINSINLGFGTRIYKNISLGITGNVYTGRVVSEERRSFGRVIPTFYGDALYENDVYIIDSTAYGGFNTTLGLMYTGEKLKVGAIVRTPFELRGESDSTHYMWSTRNGVGVGQDDSYGIFQTDTVYVDDMTSRIEQPLMLGLGLSYKLQENWLMAADFEYRGFSGMKIKNLESLTITSGGDTEEKFTTWDPNWSDVVQFRVGTEYNFQTKIGEIPIRAGFRNEAFAEGNISGYEIKYDGAKGSAVIDSTRIFYILDYDDEQVTGYSFSFGTGIHWSQILLDVAYTYTTYDQSIYTNDNALKSDNDWKNHHLNFTFTGYF